MQIQNDKIVTLDFETYYAVGYSLTDVKINMSEYVRDERFHIHCLGIKIGDGPTRVLRGDEVEEYLKSIDWSDKYVLAHNTAFDGFILSERFGIKPKAYLDTLSMSRALYGQHNSHTLEALAARLDIGIKEKEKLKAVKGLLELPEPLYEKLAEYCGNDVDLCYRAFSLLYPCFPDQELELVDLTLKMFCVPKLLIDNEMVAAEVLKQREHKIVMLAPSILAGITPQDLSSAEKFAELLRAAGIEPLKKKSKTTGKPTYAFAKSDPEFKALLASTNDKVKALAQARLAIKSTISETRAERLRKAGEGTLRLPVLLNYYGAHTGRWSGGNKLNLQNLPRGSPLRTAILAPKGMCIVVADSAQIEARTTAWLAGEYEIIDGFANGIDVYKALAAKIYGKAVEDISTTERFVGKTCILGLGYGMGAIKLQDTLAAGVNGPVVKLTLDECSRIVEIYRAANPAIVALWDCMNTILREMAQNRNGKLHPISWEKERIILPNQMKLLYPNLGYNHGTNLTYDTRYGFSKIYGGALTENVVQALARIIVAGQMLEIAKRYEVVTMSHDEVVWLAPEAEAEESFEFGKQIMRTAPKWAAGLPLGVSGGYDKRYSK